MDNSNNSLQSVKPIRFKSAGHDDNLCGWFFPATRQQETNSQSALQAKPVSTKNPAITIVFIHATGFCASTYKQVFANNQFDVDIFAPDMRGHGKTGLPTDPKRLKSWSIYSEDINAFLDNLKNGKVLQGEGAIPDKQFDAISGPILLAGHSMGAVTALMASKNRDDIVGAAMIEPVIIPDIVSKFAASPLWSQVASRFPIAVKAEQRRNRWDSRDAVFESYKQKPIFANWHDGILLDYLEDGLRPIGHENCDEGASGVELCCAPSWEAATFRAQANSFWSALRALTNANHKSDLDRRALPIHVLAGRVKGSTISAHAEAQLHKVGIKTIREEKYGHLLPMENPALAARFLKNVIAALRA